MRNAFCAFVAVDGHNEGAFAGGVGEIAELIDHLYQQASPACADEVDRILTMRKTFILKGIVAVVRIVVLAFDVDPMTEGFSDSF